MASGTARRGRTSRWRRRRCWSRPFAPLPSGGCPRDGRTIGGSMRTRRLAAVLALAGGGGLAWAESWPQWGGPERNFKAVPAGRVAPSWPASGPRELWSRPLGEGYSAIAADGAALYSMYRPVKGLMTVLLERVWSPATAPEVVIAIDAASGRTVWEHVYDAPILPRMNVEYGPGPHATPLIVGDMLYAVGSTGRMHALDRKTGRVL